MSLSRRIVRSRKDYDLAYLMDYIKKKQKEQEESKRIIYHNPDLNLRQMMIIK
ncbi:MAG: hypothetical protein U9R34_08445 [Nanoarchaeota archaeon]|nr:hypothetical protein [Nanoarchaeota archaeon]